MLLAVLYCEPDQVAAAAFACDQTPMGDRYWSDVFPGEIADGSIHETAYVNISDYELGFKLLNMGIDDLYDGRELALEIEASNSVRVATPRAA